MGQETWEILTPQWTFLLLSPSLVWISHGLERLKRRIPGGKFLHFLPLNLSNNFFLPVMEYIKAMRKHPDRRLKCSCPLSVQGVSGTTGVPGENAWPLTADFYDHAREQKYPLSGETRDGFRRKTSWQQMNISLHQMETKARNSKPTNSTATRLVH